MPKLITKLTLSILALTALSAAQALQVVVMDSDLTKVGYSKASAGKMNLFVTENYSGPVVLLVAREGNEQTQYSTLQDRYDGFLKNGQLSLKDDAGQTVNLAKLLLPYKISLNIQVLPQNGTQNTTQSANLPALKSSEKRP